MNTVCKTACKPLSDIEIQTPQIAFEQHELFNAMRPSTLKAMLEESRAKNYPKGHILFMHEDAAEWFYALEYGWVKLFRETMDGDEAVLDVLPPGSLFGETSGFERGSYAYGAEIIEDVKLYVYPLAYLEREARENPQFALAFLRHISQKGLMKDKEIELRSVQNASQRLGCFLLRLCKNHEQGAVIIHLAWEKSLIAARLGMTPETFSRSLAKLQKDIGLNIKGPTLEIPDLNALVRYTCTACSNVFPCDN
jgi:CRP/FNR family transcriptional regulator, dissimilatory nitrate respiration regulator